MGVTVVTTSTPHCLKVGDMLATSRGDTLIVRKASPYSFTASPPRWYERLRWWVRAKFGELAAWARWKQLERRLRPPK